MKRYIEKYNTPHKLLFENFTKWTFSIVMIIGSALIVAVIQVIKLFQ